MDASAEAEKRLALGAPGFLKLVGRPGRWRVWAVRGARPLADPPASMTRLGPEGFTLRFRRPGSATVRVRSTPYWSLASGIGCVGPAPGGWTRVSAEQAGRLTVRTRFGLGRIRASSERCR
jgi:hypothetical protein